MKALQKASKFLSDYTSLVVIAIAVVTFFVPAMMGWVNNPLFVDPVSNKFTCQSIIIGIIMFSMGLTLTTEDFKILAQRPFDICIGAIAQYLIMPFLAFALTKVLQLPDGIALGLILVGCCPGGVSSNIMSYLCGGDVAFSVGMTTVSTIISPVMTPLMVSLLASGTHITIKGLPMFVSIVETVIVPVAFGFLLNYLFGKKKTFTELQKVMPGVAVLGLACVVGGVVSSQGDKFFESGVVIFVAVFLHNGLGYLLGYGAGRLVGMNTAKKRTISIEVGMQNAGLATNLLELCGVKAIGICGVDTETIGLMLDNDYIPVIVPNDIDNESEYIDPRETALEIAEKMQADKLVYLSKYPGIYKDEERKDIYYKITVPEVEKLRKERNFPKEFDEIIGYGLQASKNGVNRVHILDGRIRHVLLIEFFSVNGAGTIFIETEAKLYLHELGK